MNKPLPKDVQPGTTVTRANCLFDRAAIDIDARTVEIAFSSETPVERWWGMEILDHATGAMRDKRIKRGGALLMDHDWRDQVGVIESVRIDADRVGRAVVRFGRSARASEIFQDVQDGIRTNISVSYRIHKAVLEKSEDGVETYRITDWEPHEISVVSVPADINVGVGRSADNDDSHPSKEPKMDNNQQQRNAEPAQPVDTSKFVAQGADAERQRTSAILAIANNEGYKRYNLGELANEAVRSGMSVDEFRAKAMEKMTSAPMPSADIGMSDKDKRQYSLVRALHFLANPNDAAARNAAGFEIECSLAAAQKSGKASRGLIVPFDVLARDLTVGTATAGGHTVSTNLLSGSFIDMLRNAQVIAGMGAQYLTGLQGNIAIPRQTGGATYYWVAESGGVTESQQAFDQVTMSPKTIGAMTDISRKLLLQSSIDVEAFTQRDLATTLALGIQQAAINGSGASNQPLGILGTVGIGNVAGGTNGLAPTWDHIVDLETAVAVANADVGTLGYLTNAKVRGKLKKTFVDGPGAGERVWQQGDAPLNGYRAGVTNAVPSNLDKGTSADVCSAIVFGNWADLIIGMWGGLDLLVDPYTGGAAGTVRVIVHQDVDVAVRHAESFAAMLDALT
ncbi:MULTISPECIES: phage major capsid protein [unclassified Pseudoxanthomonas]|uniref:phage major capsid protein n=1 Tax=unclassified Pseudoxanthomonas TaxID=2645906 RepID=UPI00307D676E